MRLVTTVIAITLVLTGCDNISLPHNPALEFELRDFVVEEEKTDATEYSKAYNKFKGTGTLTARNVSPDRNILVMFEVRDMNAGPNSEPDKKTVMVRGGIGKVEVTKMVYGEMSAPPVFQWNALGWIELNKATIQVTGTQAQ